MDAAFLSPKAKKAVENAQQRREIYKLKDAAQARMIEREAKQMTEQTFNEAPASVSVKCYSPAGFDVMLTIRDSDSSALMGRLKAALGYLEQNNYRPTAGGHTPSANGNGAAPVCQFHGAMKRSTKFDGWFCPNKMGDGSYCKEQVKD